MRDWLERNLTLLERIAQRLLNRPQLRYLPIPFIEEASSTPEDRRKALVHELAAFLLESPRLWPEILGLPSKHGASLAYQRFRQHLIDQSRRADTQSYPYFRKNFLGALEGEKGFRKHRAGRIMFYSLPPHGQGRLHLTRDEWSHVALPSSVPCPPSHEGLRKAAVLRDLAACFTGRPWRRPGTATGTGGAG